MAEFNTAFRNNNHAAKEGYMPLSKRLPRKFRLQAPDMAGDSMQSALRYATFIYGGR